MLLTSFSISFLIVVALDFIIRLLPLNYITILSIDNEDLIVLFYAILVLIMTLRLNKILQSNEINIKRIILISFSSILGVVLSTIISKTLLSIIINLTVLEHGPYVYINIERTVGIILSIFWGILVLVLPNVIHKELLHNFAKIDNQYNIHKDINIKEIIFISIYIVIVIIELI